MWRSQATMLNLIIGGGLPRFAAPRWRGLMGQSARGRCVREGGSVRPRRLCTSADGSGCGLRAGLKEKVFGVLTEAERTELLTALNGAAQSAGKAAAAAAEGAITRPTLIQVSLLFIMMSPCRLLLNLYPFFIIADLAARSIDSIVYTGTTALLPSRFAHPSLWVTHNSCDCHRQHPCCFDYSHSPRFTSFAASSVFFGGNDADDWIWICGQCDQYVSLLITSVPLKLVVAVTLSDHT